MRRAARPSRSGWPHPRGRRCRGRSRRCRIARRAGARRDLLRVLVGAQEHSQQIGTGDDADQLPSRVRAAR